MTLAVTATASTLLSPSNKNPCTMLLSSINSHFLPNGHELRKKFFLPAFQIIYLSISLEDVLGEASGLLVGAVVPAGGHQGGAPHLLEHLVEILSGGLHRHGDQGLNVDAGLDLLIGGQPGDIISIVGAILWTQMF